RCHSSSHPVALQLSVLLLLALGIHGFIAYRRDVERATALIASICRREGLQWLDQSVRLERLRAGWRQGPLWTRDYGFDCSGDRASRWHGSARLEGNRLRWVVVETPDGRVYLDGGL
ncbi:MAG: DUF3301 domain-containing protein, partial [Xanthomonadales bacterium]|nr:DUF3301 domain-containing protein [Xanthomonadales bacterium]